MPLPSKSIVIVPAWFTWTSNVGVVTLVKPSWFERPRVAGRVEAHRGQRRHHAQDAVDQVLLPGQEGGAEVSWTALPLTSTR